MSRWVSRQFFQLVFPVLSSCVVVGLAVGCGQTVNPLAAEDTTSVSSPSPDPTPTPVTTASSSPTTPTIALDDTKIIQASTKRAGINLGSMNYYDTGQLLKNLVGSINPGFEPTITQQIWVVQLPGTNTTFIDPDAYDTVPANYWAGGKFSVVASQFGGAELGCTGTIASNTGPNYPNEINISPTFTMATPCAAPFNIGDVVIFSKTTSPTPESWWESNRGGIWTSINGGGKVLSDTTDLCSQCGSQALQLNASTSGSAVSVSEYFDAANTQNLFVLMNGTYQISFWAKAAAGSPSLSVSASRTSAGGFNCGTFTPALTSTWTQFTFNCKAAESQTATTPGIAGLSFSVHGGAVNLDNVDFERINGDATNTTVFRDEVINTLKTYYNISSGGNGGALRYWLGQNGETADNWTRPDYARMPSAGGAFYFSGPNGGSARQLSLEDYLIICQLLHAEPYLEIPVTITTTDAAALIEFLAGSSSTPYGSRRAALGQTSPWTSVFKQIHLSYCNECWNGGTFPGQSLPWRLTQPANEYMHDYGVRLAAIFSAMRASSSYSASAFDLVMNAQTAVNWSMDVEISRAHPDSIEIEGYTYNYVNDYSSDAALWGPAMVEPFERVTDSNEPSNFYASVNGYQNISECGASGSETCKVNLYEWGQNTLGGLIDQKHMDYINAGAGEGVISVLEPMLAMQYYGITDTAYFALAEFQNGGLNGRLVKLWGNTVDIGGATNNVRPQFLALSLMNKSVIGPMYACPITNNATYNFLGSIANGTAVPPGTPALSNVPYLYAFCFENGAQRSMVLVNSDLTNSHTIAFSGTNPPAGTVTQRQYSPANLNDMNEANTGTVTNKAKATVALTTSTLSNPLGLTLPPHSVTALDYTAVGTPQTVQVSTPVISPASGSYTNSVAVSMSDSTSGATIYYTTDGSTPTKSSKVYSSSFVVSSSETVKAIAVLNGSTTSGIASADYTVQSSSTSTPGNTPGFSWSQMKLNGSASIQGSALQLTSNQQFNTASAWTSAKVPITSFSTQFAFQMSNAVADGMTFTIQNDPHGTAAMGITGLGLGYWNLNKSVAIKFDLFNNDGEGNNSTGLYKNGAVPSVPANDLSSSGINLHSGDIFNVALTYDGKTLTMQIKDTKTGATATKSYTVNIAQIVGGTTAYVGFTGGTGGYTATQRILSWSFTNDK